MGNKVVDFPQVYIEIMHNLMAHASSNNAQTTIEGLKSLYFNKKKLSVIDDEFTRNNEVFRVTHLEAEPGFITGSTPEEREESVDSKIQLLLDAYYDAKGKDYLDHFYLGAFESDKCFNHRLEHLVNFATQHKVKVAPWS